VGTIFSRLPARNSRPADCGGCLRESDGFTDFLRRSIAAQVYITRGASFIKYLKHGVYEPLSDLPSRSLALRNRRYYPVIAPKRPTARPMRRSV